MNSVEEFKESLVIEYQEEFKSYGHFPFQIVSEDPKGKITFGAMLLDNIKACYKVFHDTMKAGAKNCYMSVDFPAMEGLDTDFIAVFSYESKDRNMSVVAIPYNTKTGEKYPEISSKDNSILAQIAKEFCFAALKEAGLV